MDLVGPNEAEKGTQAQRGQYMQTPRVGNRSWGGERTILPVWLSCHICQGGIDTKPQPCTSAVFTPGPTPKEATSM